MAQARLNSAVLIIGFIFSCVASARGEEHCPLPVSPFSNERNIFSPEQEMYLGEVVAQREEPNFRVFDDSALNSYLQRVGDRLLQYLPPTGVKYTFVVVDVPLVNAWGMPGGKIYVTRKMVAFVRSEEELAGLLAHEIGHIYTHQQAIDYTRWFREYLNVEKVGDREDVVKRYNQLLDNWKRKRPDHRSGREEKEQSVADQLALYAMGRAGYSPQRVPDFFDRLAETHGKTGGFFSDFFGLTSDDSR